MKQPLSPLLAMALCAGLSAPALPTGHYAAAAINSCVAKGIASGYSDGTFSPNDSVTQAQFCVMLCRAFYLEFLKTFDTEENQAKGWFIPFTEALYDLDIEQGALAETSFENDCMNAAVMNIWMNSSGHRANILNEKLKSSIGIGCVNSYWVQMFIG